MNEWEDTPFFHKFCSSFWSCGLRETSRVVDYTTERRKTERKNENVSPWHHRPTTEREEIFFREIKNYLKFISLIEVCHNEIFENIFHKFCSFWSSCVLTFVYGRLHGEREERLREKSLWMFPHYIITAGPPQQREEVWR